MSSRAFGLCGADCRYRSLYEGSQASLADMATKQAAALTRVGRLRSGLVAALKQTFPVEFSDAETTLGRRMSAVDDEVLLAYLTGFLAMPKTQTAARASLGQPGPVDAGSEDLRAALAELGVVLPAAADPREWATAVRGWAAKRTPPQVRITAPTGPGAAPVVEVSPARMAPPTTGPADPDADIADDMPDSWDDAGSAADFGPPLEPPLPPADLPGAPDAGWDLTDLFADDPGPAPAPQDGPDVPASSSAPTPPPAAPAPEPSTDASGPGTFADLFGDPLPARDKTRKTTTRTAGPLKPEAPGLPAKKTTRRKPTKRTSRVSATAPASDPRGELAAAAAAGELTDELRAKLLATVCMTRPVFIADLVHLVGNADLVAQWERECRDQGTASPIRFIAAKQRHKARGHLVIPFAHDLRTATAEFEKSLWAQCINNPNLRGAKLYELAVLLHRVIDNIVTFDIGNEIVTMRVNQPRGIVGVIVVLSSDVSVDTEVRAELAGALTGMSTGRLSLLVICSYAGGQRTIPDLAEAAREDIEAAALTMTCPVIAQASWEFAADGGTSAVSVLG